jgi:thiosulfate/3-mercaptopyruvate sulfurtransferase
MMKKALMAIVVILSLSLCIMLISQGAAAVKPIHLKPQSRVIPAIVSEDWLNSTIEQGNLPNLVVLDIRNPNDFEAGHIPGAVNVSESLWYVNDPGSVPFSTPWMEMPSEDYLFELISNAGITEDSIVVVVGNTSGPLSPPLALYSTAGITRVAITLLYAGVKNVAILDGGYEAWAADPQNEIETGQVTPVKKTFIGKVDRTMIASIEYVKKRPGKIVDARDPDVYFGVTKEPWTAYPGHIPTAKCLPTPWLWNINLKADGTVANITYKDIGTLEKMASGVIEKNKNREIIVYCGVGGYASTLYFVLSEVLGYKNVKIYDGSAQEWTWAGEPVVVYQWE